MHNQMEERSEDLCEQENVNDKEELINQIMDNERVYLHIFDYETREFSGLTTYHGLVRIYNSKTWPSRIFWCCVVMSCLSLFMIHSGILLWTYHQKPTLTQVNIIVPEKGIIFPEITICNINPISFKKTKYWNMSDEVLDYVLKAYNDDASASEIILTKQEKEFQNYLKLYYNNTKNKFNFFDFFYNTGHDCNSMIKACSWGGEIIKNCCSKVEYVMTDYGRCLKFSNKDQKLKQRFSGSHFGWEFLIDVRYNDRPKDLPPDFADVGIKMLIHEVNKTSMIRSNGIGIPIGNKLYTGLDVKNITLLPKDDWGNCQRNWDPLIHGDNIVNQTYSTGMCQRNCMIKKMKEQCNCVSLSRLGHINNEKICSPLELYNCMKKITGNYNYLNCQCNVECFRIEYAVHTSYSRLHYTSKHLNNLYNVTKEYFINNYVGTAIYFREITYELHEQQKQMQTADLLSNIAGSMGLFLGMSTVTLLEIFIYLFKSVWGNVNKDRQTQFTEAMVEEYAEEMNNDIIVVSSENNNSTPEIEENNKNKNVNRRFSIFNINKDPIERRNSMIPTGITSLTKKPFDDVIRRNSINPTVINVHPSSNHLNIFNNIARRPSQNFINFSRRPSFIDRQSFQVDGNKLYQHPQNNSNIPVIVNQPVSSQPRRLSIFDAFQRQNLNNDSNKNSGNFQMRRNSAFIPNSFSPTINQETSDGPITVVLNKNNNRRFSTQFPTRHRDSFIY